MAKAAAIAVAGGLKRGYMGHSNRHTGSQMGRYTTNPRQLRTPLPLTQPRSTGVIWKCGVGKSFLGRAVLSGIVTP